jgi:hypothetical protein
MKACGEVEEKLRAVPAALYESDHKVFVKVIIILKKVD